jgi:iron complex outermembrane receptor protein
MLKIIRITLIPVLIFYFNSAAFSQRQASIKGKVLTSDGLPASDVNIGISDIGNMTTTDDQGTYQIKKLKKGTYVVAVSAMGLQAASKTVILSDNETQVVDFILTEGSDQLKEVKISANKQKYKIDQPSSSLRLNAPLLEIPQNIQIITSSALSDQQVISMSDGVLRNVSGTTRLEHWGDMYTNVLMRGSQVQAFRNGFNVVSSFWGPLTEDMSFVDHIEVVKGPAGFMISNGDPSGLYNVVTKKPTGQTKAEVNMTMGSFNLFRTTLDLDGKLSDNGKLLYRLNLAGQNKKSFRANEFNNRYSIAPVVSYQIDDQTKITAEYTLQSAKMSDVGSFYVFSPDGYASLPRDFTTLPPGLDPTKINDHSAFLTFEHQLNDHWKLTAQGSYFNYSQKGSSMWPRDVYADGKMIRGVDIWDAKSTMAMGQVFLNGTVETGKIRHRIIAGLDVGSKDYQADWAQSHVLDTVGGEFDPHNPVYGVLNNGYPAYDRSLGLGARAVIAGGVMDQSYSGLYLQDELGFFENRIRLTLAGRYSYVKQSSWGAAPDEAKRFTPRVGLSVSIDKTFSAYGLYDQAFIPQGGKMASGAAVKPVTGSNIEGGLKKDWFSGKWNTTLSIYRILKYNELTTDPNSNPNDGLSVELGEKRAQGVEFDLRGEILKGLNVTANYAYTDSKITRLNVPVAGLNVGDPVPGFAKHTVNTWLGYKIQSGALQGTGISAGFTYLADRATANYSRTNSEQNLPDYFKLDGGLFWENDKLRITSNVFNILDKYLYSGAYYTGYFSNAAYSWQAEAPRNYRLSIAYRF